MSLTKNTKIVEIIPDKDRPLTTTAGSGIVVAASLREPNKSMPDKVSVAVEVG